MGSEGELSFLDLWEIAQSIGEFSCGIHNHDIVDIHSGRCEARNELVLLW